MPGIVLHQVRLVYWPIPKCASTTVKLCLAKSLGLHYDNVHDASFETTAGPIAGYTDVALVRHPLRRLYSLWASAVRRDDLTSNGFLNGLQRGIAWPNEVRHSVGFDEFVRVLLAVLQDRADPHFAAQTSQVPAGVVFFRLEEVGHLLDLLAGHDNRTCYAAPCDAAYGDDLRRLASQHFQEDIARFGYDNFDRL